MSYDLMAFAPKAAPSERVAFLDWYRQQTKWTPGRKDDDPSSSSPALRAWFLEMIKQYPAMNGPYSQKDADVDDPRLTDYSVSDSIIYAAFAWSEAQTVHAIMLDLAKKHGVGFFDVSAENGGVWVPKEDGQYVCIHGVGAIANSKGKSTKNWWEFWK
jgi:hypothetical protein